MSEKLSRGSEAVATVVAGVGNRRAFVRGGRRRHLLGGGDVGRSARGRIDLEGLDAGLHIVEVSASLEVLSGSGRSVKGNLCLRTAADCAD